MHRSCILFSALVCPFLHSSTARRRLDIGKGQARGPAQILAFERYGTELSRTGFWVPESVSGDSLTDAEWRWQNRVFRYEALVERILFDDVLEDIGPLYGDALAADAEVIDVGSQLYWG
ncbi:hypothetical protein MSAS_22130 [Mycobacterium saskatchewanense]|nr:hypothetical protein MSAS_22130 [Mycobacterium saskatchewanense]